MNSGSQTISIRLKSEEVEALVKFSRDDFRKPASAIRMFVIKALQEKGYLKEVTNGNAD
tara:strand:+ start:1562 stop:1738 length:177 start_codon:yes stop_codon:yes gene_type:complete